MRKRSTWAGAVAGVVLASGLITATAAPASAAGERWPTVRSGALGHDTVTVQHLLRTAKLPGTVPPSLVHLKVDGRYGPTTTTAVRDFQRATGLKVDGVVGAATWSRLVQPVNRGDRSEQVLALQRQLLATGADLRADGAFGPATERALRAFQGARQLPITGGADDETWRALVAVSRS